MKRPLHKQTMIAAAVLLCLSAAVSAAGKKVQIRQPQTEELVSGTLIRQAGWMSNWQLNLPVKTNEQIDRLFIHGTYLYALTDTNILFCIDRQKGRTLHAVTLCQPDLPLCSPIFYEGRLGFIAGNQIRVFDPSSGVVQEAEAIEQVGNIFECGVSRNTDYIYIAGSDRRLHAISEDGYWQAFSATADNDSPINSVMANDDVVVFATQAGNVVGMNPRKAEKFWQFDISGRIEAPLVADEQYVYAAGMDAKLYKLGKESGRMAWSLPYHTGAPIRDVPVLGAATVYVYNDLNGLYAINNSTGQSIWNLADGVNTLCEADGKAFVFARPAVLKVMDNASGKELYSVNFSQVQRYAVNTTDSVMYVSDVAGRVMSVTVK